MSKEADRRKQIEDVYNGLDPKSHKMLPFPKPPYEGCGTFSDEHLAEVVFFGSRDKQDAIAFALKLGRELERKGL